MKSRFISGMILFLAVELSAAISSGDGSSFHLGSKYLSGGLSISDLGVFTAVDVGVHDLISLGAAAGFNQNDRYSSWRYRRFPVLGKIAIHPLNFSFLADILLIREKIDIYGGIAAGYVRITSKWNGARPEKIDTPDASGLTIGEYLGIRITLNDKWHIFFEDCGAITNFAVGVGRWF